MPPLSRRVMIRALRLVFAPPGLRRVAALGYAGLLALINATGNYGFFTLIVIALCVSSLDDAVLERIVPRRFLPRSTSVESRVDDRGELVERAFEVVVDHHVSELGLRRELLLGDAQASLLSETINSRELPSSSTCS